MHKILNRCIINGIIHGTINYLIIIYLIAFPYFIIFIYYFIIVYYIIFIIDLLLIDFIIYYWLYNKSEIFNVFLFFWTK